MTLLKKEVIISPMECTLTSDGQLVKSAIADEKKWQTAAHRLVSEEVQSVDVPIGWAAFHVNAQQPCEFDVTILAVLAVSSVVLLENTASIVSR